MLKAIKSFRSERVSIRKDAFSLTEILVVMVILSILISLMLPSIKGAIESGRKTGCVANLRNIYIALQSYRGDHNMAWPPFKVDSSTYGGEDTWTNLLLNYGAKKETFRCPSATHIQSLEWKERDLGVGWYGDYAYNFAEYGRNAEWTDAPVRSPGGVFDLDEPSRSVLVIESTVYSFEALGNPNTTPSNHERTDHSEKMNVLMADGHIEHLSKDQYWSFPVDWGKAPYVSSQLK